MLPAVSAFLKASSFKQRGTVTGLHGSSIKRQASSATKKTQLNSIVKLERYNMTKKEKKELEESLELLKNWELIEIILDQAKQLEKA